MRSYDFGNHVVIIVEGGNLGGIGIMNGALTSKTLWELSTNYATAKRTDRGYRASKIDVNYSDVKDRVYQAAREKQYQLLSQIETFSKKPDSMKSITLLKGWAKLKTNQVIVVKTEEGHVEIHADHFVIATGSTPREHPLLKIDQKKSDKL